MKLLPLTQDKFAKVDDEDFDLLNQFKWRLGVHTLRDGKAVNYYGQRTIYLGINPDSKAKTLKGKRKQQVITLGKFILGIGENRELRADYIDGDNLNNQKYNLRIASVSQINYGATIHKHSSKYTGVSYRFDPKIAKGEGKSYWRATVTINKRNEEYSKIFPFTAEGEIECAKWYDKMAKIHHGEFAKLNFPT